MYGLVDAPILWSIALRHIILEDMHGKPSRKEVHLFNRFAHSAGPGMVRHRVVLIGIGMDDLMRSSKGQEGTGR